MCQPENQRWTLEIHDDVEAAFFDANPSTKMYIKILMEMVAELGFVTREEWQLYAILLATNMYQNVGAALCFIDKYSGILVENLDFQQCQTDPCIFLKHDDHGNLIFIISMYVDELLIGGRKNQLEEFYQDFSECLKIECSGWLKKHLGVGWVWKTEPATKEIYLRVMM